MLNPKPALVLYTLCALFCLTACADINWQRTAKNSVESACRGSANCQVACDPQSVATASDTRCSDPSRRRREY